MANYYSYVTDFTVSVDEDQEIFTTVEVEFYLKLVDRGRPAKIYGPPEDCYPAEDPEWELNFIALVFSKSHKLSITEVDFVGLFGQKFFDKHYELAEEAANEQEL